MTALPLPHSARRRRPPRGETLIEAMVAMAVFTIGIVGVMQMNILASAQNGVARRQTLASHIGRDLVDAFERIPFNDPALAPGGMSLTDAGFTQWGADLLLLTTDHGGRPLLGASEAISLSDGRLDGEAEGAYQVGWRVAEETDLTGFVQARHVMILVRFTTVAGAVRQLNFWTVKPNPAVVVGAFQSSIEI